jgi:3-oxoadipate enol-lactonase
MLVFSHALGLDHTMWSEVVGAFSGAHPILLYDHRGHGRSPCSAKAWTLDDLVEDAATLIRAWADGPVVFVGLSMGGMVAQGLAIRHPELLRGAVFAHAVASYSEAAKQAWAQRVETVTTSGMTGVVDTVVARYLGDAFRAARPDVAASLRTTLMTNDAKAYAASCLAVSQVNWRSLLHAVRCPVLVMAGRHDIGAPVDAAQQLASAIPGAQFQILEHSAHLSPIEEPQAFVAAIQTFVHGLP